jgi:hypothetical protein
LPKDTDLRGLAPKPTVTPGGSPTGNQPTG